MTEFQIERLAEEILAAHAPNQLPVEPLTLASLEKIRLAPGEYGGCFDARIEYRRDGEEGNFYLFYAPESDRRPMSRVRFSLGHELGHFFLPEHRRYLVSGNWRGRLTECVRARRMEREANWFSAALLMPRQPFQDWVLRLGDEPRTLRELADLARNVFRTSILSTVFRYIQLNFHPCCAVMSERGEVRYALCSDEMKYQNFWSASSIPAESLTGKVCQALVSNGCLRRSGVIRTKVWFENAPSLDVWEEVWLLNHEGRMLTYLALLGNNR